jgi:hypothetical protein
MPIEHLKWLEETYAPLPDAQPKAKGKLTKAFEVEQATQGVGENEEKSKKQLVQNHQP